MKLAIILTLALAGCATQDNLPPPASHNLLSVPRPPSSEAIKFERSPKRVCGEVVDGTVRVRKCKEGAP